VANPVFCIIASYLRLLKLNYTIVLSEQKLNDKLFNRGKSRVRACVRACERETDRQRAAHVARSSEEYGIRGDKWGVCGVRVTAGMAFNVAFDQLKDQCDYFALFDIDSLPTFHLSEYARNSSLRPSSGQRVRADLTNSLPVPYRLSGQANWASSMCGILLTTLLFIWLSGWKSSTGNCTHPHDTICTTQHTHTHIRYAAAAAASSFCCHWS